MQHDDSLIRTLPRRLKMGELRVFVAVLEHGSVHKAAAALHLTQPAVTKTLAGLEATLGVRLFHRGTAGVEPTVHGLSFAPRAVAIFDELRRAAQDLNRVSGGARGTLRVGTLPMPAIPFLPVAIRRMVDAHPDILVSVVEGRETELLERVRKRDIEFAVLRLALIGLDDDMQGQSLFDEKLCVMAVKEHRLAAREGLTWAELLDERWVLPPADCFFYEHVLRTLAKADLPMPGRQVVEATSIQIQFGMVLHGGLLGFGLRSQIEFAPGKEFLVRLPFELPTVAAAVAAVSLKSRQVGPLAQQLVDHIRDLARPPSPGTDAPVAGRRGADMTPVAM